MIKGILDAFEKKTQAALFLRELGVRVALESSPEDGNGFPVTLEFASGGSLRIELPSPAPFDCLDERQIGAAVIDPLGVVKQSWGLAKRLPMLRSGKSVLNSPLSGLPECAISGETTAIYYEGLRIFAASLNSRKGQLEEESGSSDVLALVVSAAEEKALRKTVQTTERHAMALRQLGKSMAVEEGAIRVAISASHEIASCSDLAAVLIWVLDENAAVLKLASSVGVNRAGQQALAILHPGETISNAAELCAASGKPAVYEELDGHPLVSEVEGKVCYLRPGGLFLFPLSTAERTVGVLEVIGRFDDASFTTQKDLFAAFAEHLTLALNAALMYEAAEKRASHDALTGLANHRSLHEFLNSRLAEARRLGQPLGVIMIDVDHFRAFNEEEGHDAGDTVLKLTADSIKGCLRPYDLAARYGGEEFTVVIPNAGPEYVQAAAERIRAKIESQLFVTPSGQERVVTASLGCASFPESQAEAAELLKAADAALFDSKKAGRNRVTVWEGPFESSRHTPKSEIDISRWLAADKSQDTEFLLKKLEPEIDFLVRKMGLSDAQRSILSNLVRIAPTYKFWAETGMEAELKEFENDHQTRILIPSLHAMEERFDGLGPEKMKGKRIPLLARILQILLALAEHHGQPLIDDPAKFDPEIVLLLADLSSAA